MGDLELEVGEALVLMKLVRACGMFSMRLCWAGMLVGPLEDRPSQRSW